MGRSWGAARWPGASFAKDDGLVVGYGAGEAGAGVPVVEKGETNRVPKTCQLS